MILLNDYKMIKLLLNDFLFKNIKINCFYIYK